MERDKMGKQGMKKNRFRTFIPVALIFLFFVIIRYVFACLTTAYPTVGIDEFLYYSLGRSIATEGRLLYRGQPALYNYFIYPLFLAPIYVLFPEGSDFYRIIQFWNGILMNLAIFPIFSLCQRIFKNQKKALWISAAVLVLPDFSLNEFIFSEAIIYPLFFSMVYLIYLSIEEKKGLRFAGLGALGAVLYYTKPGAVVPAVVALLFFMIQGIIKKKTKEIVYALSGIGSFAVSFFLLWLVVHYTFGYQGTFLSVYSEQLETEGKMFWDVFLQTMACYPYYFCLACGVIPAVLFVSGLKYFGQNHKEMFSILIISLAIVMVGTAWLINRTEHTYVLFLRYMAMYIPLVFIGCILSAQCYNRIETENQQDKLSICGVLVCIYLIICTAIWGSTTGIGTYVENHFLVSLAVLFQPNIKGISDILIILLCALSLYLIAGKREKKHIPSLCVGIFLVSMIVNNICGYIATGSNAIIEYKREAESTQNDIIQNRGFLYIYSDEYNSDHGIDVYSKKNNHYLKLYDFYNNIRDSQGEYVPFAPVQERGVMMSSLTPDVNVIVADKTVFPLIKFSESVKGTFSKNGTYYIAEFSSGQRVADSIIANVENLILNTNRLGIIGVFKEEWINNPVTIRLEIESAVDQDMELYSRKEYFTGHLDAGRSWYEIPITKPDVGYDFIVREGPIKIWDYEIKATE